MFDVCCSTKPKDNYFFQDQRKLILDSSDGDGNDENKMSFQDIGRLIGQRWREIKPDEVRCMG
jgi:ribonuclease I